MNEKDKNEFAEKIFSAMTNIDDKLIEQAEAPLEQVEVPLEQTENPSVKKIKKRKKPKKFLTMAACLALVMVIAIPVIIKVSGGQPKDTASPKAGITEQVDGNAEESAVKNKNTPATVENGPIEEKNGLVLNAYDGHGLDGSSYGTKEIFSVMKSSELPTYGECYIVAINNETTGEVIKIFSATGYELKMAFAGNCLDDVIEKLG